MKFYIAAKFEDKENVHRAIQLLTEAGHTVPYDWTASTTADTEQALKDLEGVKGADALLGLFTENHNYRGAVMEVGMACALGKYVIIVGDWLDGCIFMHLYNVFRVNSIEKAVLLVEGLK